MMLLPMSVNLLHGESVAMVNLAPPSFLLMNVSYSPSFACTSQKFV